MARPKPARRQLPPKPESSPEETAALRAELEARLEHIRLTILKKRRLHSGVFDADEPASPSA